MELTRETSSNRFKIQKLSNSGIVVSGNSYTKSIIINQQEIIDWQVTDVSKITESDVYNIIRTQPSLVIIGSGKNYVILPAKVMHIFYKHRIGVEVMTTQAACRTFTILAAENRNFVCALII